MQELETIVLGLLQSNGGQMEYRAIYDHPDVLNYRQQLHRLKVKLRNEGVMTPSVAVDPETKQVRHLWVLEAN